MLLLTNGKGLPQEIGSGDNQVVMTEIYFTLIFKRRVMQPFVNGLLYSQALDYICQGAIESTKYFCNLRVEYNRLCGQNNRL